MIPHDVRCQSLCQEPGTRGSRERNVKFQQDFDISIRSEGHAFKNAHTIIMYARFALVSWSRSLMDAARSPSEILGNEE